METFEIKSRWNGTVLFTSIAATLAEAVNLAIQARANLSGANLYYNFILERSITLEELP